jgi:hypothetical protein
MPPQNLLQSQLQSLPLSQLKCVGTAHGAGSRLFDINGEGTFMGHGHVCIGTEREIVVRIFPSGQFENC